METPLDGSSDTRDAREKTRFAQYTRSIIRAVALVFGLLVAYLQIKDVKPDALLTPTSADILWRIALVFYYWSWVGGINFDLNFQELAYKSFPGQGRWPLQLYFVLAIFVVMAVVLLLSFGNIAHFSLALTGFLVVDHLLWLFVRLFLRKSIDDSRARYAAEKKFYELEILNMVETQIFGRWKLWRLLTGAAVVIVADALVFNQAFRDAFGSAVQIICPWLSAVDAVTLAYSLFFLLYVLVMELWLWSYRMRLYIRLETMEYLDKLYQLYPR